MILCEKCGTELPDGTKFCDECGTKVSGPSFVKLSENEIKIKTYHCTTLKKPRGEGYITVTNKRIVFHGYGGSSKLTSEVHIETVTGISTYFGRGLNILFLILGILASLACLFFLSNERGIFSGYAESWVVILTFITLGLAIWFFCLCRQASYNLAIFSSGANGTPIILGDGSFGSMLTRQGALLTVSADPTSESEILMNELGAIVLDLKSMGDHAIKKWIISEQNGKIDDCIREVKTQVAAKSDEEFFK